MDELLSRKMSRAEFLKLVGLGTLSLFGVGAFLQAMAALDAPHRPTRTPPLAQRPDHPNGVYIGQSKGRA